MKKHKENIYFRMKCSEHSSKLLHAEYLLEFQIQDILKYYNNATIIPRLSQQNNVKKYELKNGKIIIDSPLLTFIYENKNKINKEDRSLNEAARIAENLCLTKKQEQHYMFLLEDVKFRKLIDEKLINILNRYKSIHLDKEKRYSLLRFKNRYKKKWAINPLPLP